MSWLCGNCGCHIDTGPIRQQILEDVRAKLPKGLSWAGKSDSDVLALRTYTEYAAWLDMEIAECQHDDA